MYILFSINNLFIFLIKDKKVKNNNNNVTWYGADKINMIQGNGKKLKKMAKRIIRIAFKVSDSKKKKKSNITFVLTKKNI